MHKLIIGLTIALIIRLIILVFPYAFWIDMNSFRGWMENISVNGISNFYQNTWCDYPPGYLYILGFLGKVSKLYESQPNYIKDRFTIALLKFLPIVSDLSTSIFIWLFLREQKNPKAVDTAIIYALNPLVLFVSAIWGQVDSFLSLLMMIATWLLLKDRFILASILSGIMLIVKPQGLFFIPIVLLTQWFRNSLWKWVITLCASLATIWVVVVPFYWNQVIEQGALSVYALLYRPFSIFYHQMLKTASTYPFASVNAFNLWGFVNWKRDDLLFWGISYRTIGLILLSIILLLSAILYYRKRKTDDFFIISSLVLVAAFIFLTRMHERYIFYSISFLSISSAFFKPANTIYWLFTFTGLTNILYAFMRYNHEKLFNLLTSNVHEYIIFSVSTINILTVCFLLIFLLRHVLRTNIASEQNEEINT